MKVTKALIGLAAAAAALTLAPTADAQEAGTLRSLSSACSAGGESTHMFSAAACPSPFLDKREYAPGETIKINEWHDKKCGSFEVISAGFAVKIKFTEVARDGRYLVSGETRAVTTPGTYQAETNCDGVGSADQFTVVAPTPPAPGKPKPPITKPRGAADTGGGGTVVSIP
jgi:hypothetical protein